MPLDGAFGDTELAGDLLVQPAPNDQVEDLAFGRRQGVDAGTQDVELLALATIRTIARDGPLDGAQQHIGVDRLGQKVLGAGLHGQNGGRDVAMAGNEDDRTPCAACPPCAAAVPAP